MQKKSSNTIEQQKHSHKISNANIQMHMVKMNVSGLVLHLDTSF